MVVRYSLKVFSVSTAMNLLLWEGEGEGGDNRLPV